jgi:LAO/AO transport system kinase
MEMADVFVLNKADRDGAQAARLDIERAVNHRAASAWRPPIIETVASEDRGTADVWAAIGAHRRHLADTGALAIREQRLLRLALRGLLEATLNRRVAALLGSPAFPATLARIQAGESDLQTAGDALLARVLSHG